MRFVLVLLLFQFIAPALVPGSPQVATSNQETCIDNPQRQSLIIPVLLKEKEETESRGDDAFADVAPLIDFSDHRYVLAEFHTSKFTPRVYLQQYDHRPPLFMLHGAFLI
jgi:hypothetical protein